jgi:hypothetical protein
MASELSRLIEDELKNKGLYVEDEEEPTDEEAPHQALMGALRVEVRVWTYTRMQFLGALRPKQPLQARPTASAAR